MVPRSVGQHLGGDDLVALAAQQHGLVAGGGPGMWVTSTMHRFMQIRPTSGARRPRISTWARPDRARGQPSA